MKNSIDKNNANIQEFIREKNVYIQEIIENTIVSIQQHKKNNLFSENDVNLSVSILLELYEKINNINIINKELNIDANDTLNLLQRIIDKLSLVICGFGTKNIKDMLFVCFGSEFKNLKFDDEILNDKLKLIFKYVHPISYKLISWKKNKNDINDTSYCSDKITDEIIEFENLNQIECINDNDINDIPILEKINYLKCVIQNKNSKKTLIINGIIDNIPIHLLNNKYIHFRMNELNNLKNELDGDFKDICKNIIDNLSLKDILIYSKDDICKKTMLVIKDVQFIKQNHIDIVVKKFLEFDITSQRNFFINLLLYVEDNDIEYTCYILYDLINSSSTNSDNSSTILYDTLPWSIKQNFKNIIKTNIKQNQELVQKYETSKISLEQQIHMLKVDESTKEKAMNKLKEIKNKPDEMTIKTKQYLEGLIKIPFETFYEEPMIKYMTFNNKLFLHIIENIPKKITINNFKIKQKYTNKEIIFYNQNIQKDTLNFFKNELLNQCKKMKLKNIQHICSNFFKSKNNGKNKSEQIDYIQNKIKNSNEIINLVSIYDYQNNTNYRPIIKDTLEIEKNAKLISESLSEMEICLNNSIHGHNHAKNQIMKIVGQWMNGEKSGYCFGFEGSPGIGKTSLASKGLANCLTNKSGENRPFSFIALGGSTNGSYLEGHSYTYMNSTWGRIVEILMDSKCMNPIIYIDELDKVSKTEQGKEIIGILTHLIDSTQNNRFQDKYFAGINIDLSKVLFIFSYNNPQDIDKILLDRIHRIKFENLNIQEKITIVQKYILPEINTKMGFENTINIDDDCIEHIINSYTLEPGVRKLKELLFDLYGEINLEILKNKDSISIPIFLTKETIEKYLTKYDKIIEKKIHKNSEVGIINGLWANSLGCGGIIPIQTLFYPSSTFLQLQLTGLQGDVMKESMNVAKSLAWSLTKDNIKKKWLQYFDKTKCQGLHIHCPDGSISKDGPSAGAAITTAIYSLLNEYKIKNDIAITGEITLNGNITAIGGLDIKIRYGIKAGVKQFLYPKENNRDFKLLTEKIDIPEDIKFIEVEDIKQVFNHVFV